MIKFHKFCLLAVGMFTILRFCFWKTDQNPPPPKSHNFNHPLVPNEIQNLEKTHDEEKKALETQLFGSPNISHSDPMMLDYIRKFHLFPPPPSDGTFFNLTTEVSPVNDFCMDAIKEVMKKSNKETGYFIECGANDGEFLSNTLELEFKQGWKGLLIEASPTYFPKLVTKKRKNSWLSDVALCREPALLEMFKFKTIKEGWQQGVGRMQNQSKNPMGNDFVPDGKVDCFPLDSVLKALHVKSVDFLSLDVEGNEYKVLVDFPFEEIEIKVVFVEYVNVPEGKKALQEMMEKNGYQTRNDDGNDFLFLKV